LTEALVNFSPVVVVALNPQEEGADSAPRKNLVGANMAEMYHKRGIASVNYLVDTGWMRSESAVSRAYPSLTKKMVRSSVGHRAG
jgi:hypothetical protein